VTELCVRCAALIKQSAPVHDEPKRSSRKNSISAATDTVTTPTAVDVKTSPSPQSKPKSSPRTSPHTSPSVRSNTNKLPPPPHFALSSNVPSNNPIAGAAAASPYLLQEQEQQHLLAANVPTDDTGAEEVDDPSTSTIIAQLQAVPWTEEEQARDAARTAAQRQAALAEDLVQVSAMVSEVRQLFGDIQELVANQQPQIQEIENNVADAKQHAQNGLAQLSIVRTNASRWILPTRCISRTSSLMICCGVCMLLCI
jgi:hypothetical protein